MKNKINWLTSSILVTIIIVIFGINYYLNLEPQFKITKEECVKEIDSMLQDAYLGCLIGCNFLDNLSLIVECNDYCGEKIVYKEEVCESIEVDEIEIWDDPTNGVSPLNCSTLNIGTESLLNNDGFFCKDGIVQELNVILKKDLKIEWLDENCAIYWCDVENRCDYFKGIYNHGWDKWKCGEYFVEK